MKKEKKFDKWYKQHKKHLYIYMIGFVVGSLAGVVINYLYF